MIFVRGAGSAIAQALAELVAISPVPRGEAMPDDGEFYLFCAGSIRQVPIGQQLNVEAGETFKINAGQVIRECNHLVAFNDHARICVVGSEAAFTWSHDDAYAASKAALHRYVETKRLRTPAQQLVCVSPSIILNTGMTNARNAEGKAAMEERRKRHPKGRWLEPIEVARMIHYLLCVDQGYTTGVAIRMNGGEHCGLR